MVSCSIDNELVDAKFCEKLMTRGGYPGDAHC
jgi:hypothetical protein